MITVYLKDESGRITDIEMGEVPAETFPEEIAESLEEDSNYTAYVSEDLSTIAVDDASGPVFWSEYTIEEAASVCDVANDYSDATENKTVIVYFEDEFVDTIVEWGSDFDEVARSLAKKERWPFEECAYDVEDC